jgi:heme exporter protein D
VKDYSFYIALTYGASAIGLLLLGLQSYRAMKRAKAEVESLRRKRKGD